MNDKQNKGQMVSELRWVVLGEGPTGIFSEVSTMFRQLFLGLALTMVSPVFADEVAEVGEPPTVEETSENGPPIVNVDGIIKACMDVLSGPEKCSVDLSVLRRGITFSDAEFEEWSREMLSSGIDLGHGARAVFTALDILDVDTYRLARERLGQGKPTPLT